MSYLFRDNGFDAEEYWSSREFKKYVVHLEIGRGKRKRTDRLLIQARDKGRAIECAKRHSLLRGRVDGTEWLAQPSDLGCTYSKEG